MITRAKTPLLDNICGFFISVFYHSNNFARRSNVRRFLTYGLLCKVSSTVSLSIPSAETSCMHPASCRFAYISSASGRSSIRSSICGSCSSHCSKSISSNGFGVFSARIPSNSPFFPNVCSNRLISSPLAVSDLTVTLLWRIACARRL